MAIHVDEQGDAEIRCDVCGKAPAISRLYAVWNPGEPVQIVCQGRCDDRTRRRSLPAMDVVQAVRDIAFWEEREGPPGRGDPSRVQMQG